MPNVLLCVCVCVYTSICMCLQSVDFWFLSRVEKWKIFFRQPTTTSLPPPPLTSFVSTKYMYMYIHGCLRRLTESISLVSHAQHSGFWATNHFARYMLTNAHADIRITASSRLGCAVKCRKWLLISFAATQSTCAHLQIDEFSRDPTTVVSRIQWSTR